MSAATSINANFLEKIFEGITPDEDFWTTSFATNPNQATTEWAGSPGPCGDYTDKNAYFCVSTLRRANRKLKRRKANFGRLFNVVLDDAGESDLQPTWRIRTSPEKVQIGFKLDVPVKDIKVAERLHEQLGVGGLIPADKSGNNAVRYVRVPAATNTKHSPPYPCHLEFFDPIITHKLEDLIDTLGLDKNYILFGQRNPSSGNEKAQPDHYQSDEELIGLIITAESYHDPLLKLTARYAHRGMDEATIIKQTQEMMKRVDDRSERWQSRYDDIPRMVAGAAKFKPSENGLWLSIRHGRDGVVTPLTEVGDSEILARLIGTEVRYVPEEECFILFDESWLRDDGNSRMTEIAKKIYSERKQEAGALLASGGYPEEVKAALNWAIRCQSVNALDKALELLSRRQGIRMSVTLLDANPLVIGLDGGRQVIDLRTETIRPAQPDDYITKSLNVSEIGVTGEAKRWQLFLGEIFLWDNQIVEWFRRWCGYVLTGLTREQILVFFYGQGRNGKSVLVKTLLELMGDYGRSIASETLVSSQRNSQSASPDLARLAGARFVATQETEEGSRMAESLVKSMTGGDRIIARFLNQNPFEFDPQFKLAISGNHQPIIRGNDYGVWRRIRLIPFLATFTDANDDKGLVEKLAAERHHIARWMVDAAADYLATGLGPVPDRVANATKEYQAQMDTIGQWIEERCIRSDPTTETPVGVLFCDYTDWCKDSGLKQPTKQAFGRRLSERPDIEKIADGNGRRYRGIALSKPVSKSGLSQMAQPAR